MVKPELDRVEFKDRISRVKKRMAEKDIDLLLVYAEGMPSRLNFLYLTNLDYESPSAVLLPREGEPTVVIGWTHHLESVKDRSFWVTDILTTSKDYRTSRTIVDDLVRILKERGFSKSTIGVEYDMIPYITFARLKEQMPEASFIDISDWFGPAGRRLWRSGMLEDLRMIKSPKEIEMMREASRLADVGMKVAVENVKAGVTEREIAWKIDDAIRQEGGTPGGTMVQSGEHAGTSVYPVTDRILTDGDPVIVDLHPHYGHYFGDVSRTFFVGDPSDELKKIYNVVYEAYRAGVDGLKLGVKVKDLDKKIDDIIVKAGYPSCPHRYAHGADFRWGKPCFGSDRLGNNGVGFQDLDPDVVFRENMVICVEPGIYMGGIGGVRIESAILVTKKGPQLLNETEVKRI